MALVKFVKTRIAEELAPQLHGAAPVQRRKADEANEDEPEPV